MKFYYALQDHFMGTLIPAGSVLSEDDFRAAATDPTTGKPALRGVPFGEDPRTFEGKGDPIEMIEPGEGWQELSEADARTYGQQSVAPIASVAPHAPNPTVPQGLPGGVGLGTTIVGDGALRGNTTVYVPAQEANPPGAGAPIAVTGSGQAVAAQVPGVSAVPENAPNLTAQQTETPDDGKGKGKGK